MVINFVQKDIGDMFPKWDSDVEDPAADNIIKVMFNQRPWKWTMDCWEVTGTWVKTKPAVVSPAKREIVVVKEDSPRPRKKARKEASEKAPVEDSEEVPTEARSEVTANIGGLSKEDIESMFNNVLNLMKEGFGRCLKEMKHVSKDLKRLSERVEAVEQKVGITKKEKRTSSQPSESVNGAKARKKDASSSKEEPTEKAPEKATEKAPEKPPASADASSSKEKAPEEAPEKAPEKPPMSTDASLVLLDKQVPTASDLQQEGDRYQQKIQAALAVARAKSDRTRKLAATQQSPYAPNSTAKAIIPNKKFGKACKPFAPIDKVKLKELAEWLKTDPHYRTPLEKKPRKSPTWWYTILRTPLSWLEDCHMDAWIYVLRKRYQENPQHFRSERMCFVDHLFSQQWRYHYPTFKESEPDVYGLGRRLPGGAWNYYSGTIPSFCQSNKVWGVDVDDIYAPVNYNNSHWIAMMISIPKRHIVVWDSIPSAIPEDQLDLVMEPFLHMVPYLLFECGSIEQREYLSLEPYTYERPTNIPQARSGDCGVYALKFIECHALGMPFNPKDFAKSNTKSVRDKMAVDIYEELPDQHEKDSQDLDEDLGTYD